MSSKHIDEQWFNSDLVHSFFPFILIFQETICIWSHTT